MYSEKIIKSKNQISKAPMFEKRTVVELTEKELTSVEGGTSSLIGTTSLLTITFKLQ